MVKPVEVADMGKLIVQVVHVDYDSFWEIPEELLRTCLLNPDMEARKAVLLDGSAPARVHSTREVDMTLVLDGVADQESWEEVRTYLQPFGEDAHGDPPG